MRYFKRVAALLGCVALSLATAGSASAATASGFEEFADCPDRSVDPSIVFCVSTVVHGGHLKMGSKDTPITDPISIVGGLTSTGEFVLGEFDGGRQQIPGGLIGITGLDWLIYLFPNTILGLYAEAQPAGTVPNPAANNVALPLKVKLDNILLSNSCTIGSNSDPIALNLTTGTTSPPAPAQPISGSAGSLTPDPNGLPIVRIANRKLVDNAFAVPHARNCDLLIPGFGLIDVIVNLQAGLPAAAGTNEAIQIANGATTPVTQVFPPAGIEQ